MAFSRSSVRKEFPTIVYVELVLAVFGFLKKQGFLRGDLLIWAPSIAPPQAGLGPGRSFKRVVPENVVKEVNYCVFSYWNEG